MKVILKSNDPVELSWAQALIAAESIPSVVFDTHTAIVEGSIGAIPRRLMVGDDDAQRAEALLAEARAALDAENAPDLGNGDA